MPCQTPCTVTVSLLDRALHNSTKYLLVVDLVFDFVSVHGKGKTEQEEIVQASKLSQPVEAFLETARFVFKMF